MRRVTAACATGLVMVLAWGCSGATPVATKPVATAPIALTPVSHDSKWVPVDLPGQVSEMRSAVYDQARNCLWVMSRELGGYASDPMFVTLTRVNVNDRSTVKLPFKQPADGYDAGLIAVDSHGILWMGWGQTLTRFDPDTGATKSWTLPPYSGLARLYSMDGRMVALTIDSNGEIWVAAGMVSAVFGFNPVTSTWAHPINLPFVPTSLTALLTAPAPGIITINGVALDAKSSPRFAVITTATRSVKTLPLQVQQYVAVGGGQIVYSDSAGNLRRLNLRDASSTVISATPTGWNPNANMALDSEGNIWVSDSPFGSVGVARFNPTTGAIAQFPFPTVIRYVRPPSSPTPNSCFFHCVPFNECQTPLVFHCIPTAESLNPGVQGIAPDQRGHLWMVTDEPSLTDPSQHPQMGPIVELEPAAAA